MESWMRDIQYVGRLRDAAARLVDCCGDVAGVLQASEASAEASEEQANECGASWAAAATSMWQLLGEVCAAGGASEQQAAACRPPVTARTTAALLHLPNDLLAHVGRLAGKDSRLVCSRLRDAYGPPAPTARQPKTGCEVDVVTNWDSAAYQQSFDHLRECALGQVYQRCQASFSQAALRRCSQRWPAWGPQVTRLELADTVTPDPAALGVIQQALPGLRQLVLAEEPYYYGEQPQLPQLTGVTHLGLLCSFASLTEDPTARTHPVFHTLTAVPSLRSLHLDLRFLCLAYEHLRDALQALSQLSHLELVCSLDDIGANDVRYRHEVLHAVWALKHQLQSLVFLSPMEDITLGGGRALQSLTRLTSLGCCLGWDNCAASVSHQCDWLSLAPGLVQLVLGYSPKAAGGDGQEHCLLSLEVVTRLAMGCGRSEDDVPGLQVLVLPALDACASSAAAIKNLGSEFRRAVTGLNEVLDVVGSRCLDLTSLQCGASVAVPGDCLGQMVTDLQDWLLAVSSMTQLRQLVLTVDAHALEFLSYLDTLPLLIGLWLHVCNVDLLPATYAVVAGFDAGCGLSQLTTLQHLALCMDDRRNHAGSKAVQQLLAAAGSLPQLQVLDVSSAPVLTTVQEAWLPLAASPPATLREVRLCAPADVPGWAPGGEHRRIADMLVALLPQQVAVVEHACCALQDPFGSCWGPSPRSLKDLAVGWERRQGR